ncbi:MAG: HNH endonuclease [Hyphomicrobiales bacterium]|nr:MAG: HNH endonuclease [Hyphomicrobiales bacterium]
MSEDVLTRTAARWKIPREMALKIIRRDRRCIYCSHIFEFPVGPKARWPSWEHIVNDVSLINEANIALCCWGCNASKRARPLAAWLSSSYCRDRGIDATSVALVAQAVLAASNTPKAPINIDLSAPTAIDPDG